MLKYPPDEHKIVPKFSNTRWSSLFDCVTFIIKHEDFYSTNTNTKDSFIQIQKSYDWNDLAEALSITWNLIKALEKDLAALSDVFQYAFMALKSLSAKDTSIRRQLYFALFERMLTGDELCLPCTAFLLTPEGKNAFDSISDTTIFNRVLYCGMKGLSIYAKDRKIYDEESLSHLFIQFMTDPSNTLAQCTSNIVEYYSYMMQIANDPLMKSFYSIAFEIVQIPCSEAPVERLFSHLERFLAPQCHHQSEDLLNAKATIKMNYLFSHEIPQKISYSDIVPMVEKGINNLDSSKQRLLPLK